ncbi:hypothetical protein M409DRAFT_25574 [Zasmidium cellare ATCC 36951]|uniref:Uncharacterized protein n=1 Tax=Zasmidium cellare ATCC 36951 TaxID=1080233 RepID=A0A6A6CE79_ZASCE|nr:uncharacterized protein M409DRAFT_25574 [Zasmidium cellare ATCC 36951]KAF2164232.1 hypothetical protein M409DRAFT_25574 [Zasmidium cellare ATCC 36951]
MANSRPPITDHYPIPLRYIKALFLEAQYRQCIQACRDVIKLAGAKIDDNPLQKTFVHFYLALCHDEIARSMHHNSVAKLPAFTTAAQHYQDAIDALPSQQEIQFFYAQRDTARRSSAAESFFSDDDNATVSDFPVSPTLSAYDPRDMGISRASSPVLSSPPVFRREPVLSPNVGSPGTVPSDFDDLESHDSFSELMTPNRVKREQSRMSLIGQPPKRLSRGLSRMSLLQSTPKGLPRDVSSMSLLDQIHPGIPREFSKISLHDPAPPQKIKSPTHGLMRPIRLGSPAKPHFLPPTLPYSGTAANVQSKLPQLTKATKTEPNLTTARVDSRYSSPEPPPPSSPHSNTESDSSFSNASTVSQTSPQTPVRHHIATSPTPTKYQDLLSQNSVYRLTEHILSMRAQLQRHIALVHDAQDRLHRAQQEKRASRLAPTTGTPLGPINAKDDVFSTPVPSPQKIGLPQARSYWSFVPEDIKALEKRRRIADGRVRKWKRERFQPGKYRELCERALEEL